MTGESLVTKGGFLAQPFAQAPPLPKTVTLMVSVTAPQMSRIDSLLFDMVEQSAELKVRHSQRQSAFLMHWFLTASSPSLVFGAYPRNIT